MGNLYPQQQVAHSNRWMTSGTWIQAEGLKERLHGLASTSVVVQVEVGHLQELEDQTVPCCS